MSAPLVNAELPATKVAAFVADAGPRVRGRNAAGEVRGQGLLLTAHRTLAGPGDG